MPTWGKALRIWWAFTWRWPLWMMAAVIPAAILLTVLQVNPRTATALVTWPAAIWGQLMAMRKIIQMLEAKP